MFQTSVLYEANYNATNDIIVNQGGSSSGKTYSIIQGLFTHAISNREVITVAGESIPNLKAGALRDALEIVDGSKPLKALIKSFNKTDRTFEFKNGSLLEFKSYMTPQDAKSGKRDRLFMNEANGIPYEVFFELHMRTKKRTYLDYNPNEEFWVHEKLIGQPGVKLIISDHRHNPFCLPSIRKKLEDLRDQDMELFKVYARGLTGKIEGLIFRNYQIVPEIPFGAELIACWLDWGFTNDPTSFGKLYRYNSELWADELIYETRLTNTDIAERLTKLGITRQMEIIADSAEPKSIEEVRRAGFYVNASMKGPDSIRSSIDILKRLPLNITQSSIGLKKEIKSYKWATDSTGKTLNEPIGINDHSIAGIRYVALNKIGKNSGKYSFM